MHNIKPIALFFLLGPGLAAAADVNVIGLTAGKAVVSIDGGKPQTLAVGQVSREGVKLLAADRESATFEIGGKRETLAVGEGAAIASTSSARSGDRVVLTADSGGHFVTIGEVNGVSVRFLVDTGATSIVISSAEARRIGINYVTSPRSFTQTANGVIPVYNVKLDSVRVGDVVLNNLDAVIIEGDKLPVALLGMSFLSRMEMRHDGNTLTLIRRY